MMHNLKTIGLAFVAVLVLTAAVASSASASAFTAGEYPAYVTAQQEGTENYFEVGGVKVECEVATFKGTMKEPSSTLTVELHYTECKTSLGTNAPIDTNGCHLLFHGGQGYLGDDDFDGTVDITCPAGKDITVTAGFCTIHIAPQNGIGGVTYTNITNPLPDDVTLDVNSTVKKVTGTNVFLCPKAVTEATEGQYVSKVTARAYRDVNEAEGAQIGLTVST